ncbi:universal stress protein [Halobacterium wangiae]|uniref:universal stress protein n=1 Tax=Halobacterium wangiae TaxID=2902623 RepID=UPI001E5443D8|nr:universal stress protein [Halobacterium wangiae]
MFEEILFPTDGSAGATAAFDYVLDVAATHDATVHLLHVADTTRSAVGGQEDVVGALERRGQQIVDEAAERARERGVATHTDVLRGDPYRVVSDYAASADVDVIVMPTRGRRGLARFLLGSTTERVVRRSDVPVLTLKPDGASDFDYPFENVLVATDGSDCARAALEAGVGVADEAGAALHLLSVVDVTSLGVDARIAMEVFEESANRIVAESAAFATDAGVDTVSESVEFGSSVSGVVRSYVRAHDVDLVVVGTHGRTGFDRYVLGSVAESLVRTSSVPVLTVREPTDDE